MLNISHLYANVKDKEIEIIKDFNLNKENSQIHAIMGPNGTGKSTLAKVIMGHYSYEVLSGDINFDGVDIKTMEVNERAKKGIFLCMQDPIVVEGVSNSEFLRTAKGEITGEKVNLYSYIKDMDMSMKKGKPDSSMLHRSLNQGFSGGEKKKNEVLQLRVLKPKLIILDELDSGLDGDSVRVVCDNINEYLVENPDASVLIITHYPRILEYIKPDFVHVMVYGKIQKSGTVDLAFEIEKDGYAGINVGNGSGVCE